MLKGMLRVAIKVIHIIESIELRSHVLKEAAIMDACRHPHVVQVSPFLDCHAKSRGRLCVPKMAL